MQTSSCSKVKLDIWKSFVNSEHVGKSGLIKQKHPFSVSLTPAFKEEQKADVETSSRYSPECCTIPTLVMQTNSKRDPEL